jgi:hypothetical protein
MDAKRISNTSVAILLALTTTASAGPMNFARSRLIAPQQTQTEPAYYGCHGYYGWVPDGTIAGPTGGYPYFGYPLVPYRYCGHPYHRHYGHYRPLRYRHYGSW